MKKVLIGLLIAASAVYAASVSNTLPAAGDNTVNGYSFKIVYDSTDAHDKVNVDTCTSNVLNVSDYSAIGIWMNLGTVVKCDSCNDSIKIFIETLLRGNTSVGWYRARVDTMGGNNITSGFDDSTKYRWIKLDTIPCNELMFRTIVKDSMKQVTVDSDSSLTAAVSALYTTYIPMHYVVVGR